MKALPSFASATAKDGRASMALQLLTIRTGAVLAPYWTPVSVATGVRLGGLVLPSRMRASRESAESGALDNSP